MEILRIYNNNVVVTQDDDGEEMIVIGRGLAFGKKSGERLDLSKIEKKFTLQDKVVMSRVQEFMKSIPEIYLEIAEEIVHMIREESDLELNEEIYLSLMDHISIFRAREQAGQTIFNPLLLDIRQTYKREFMLAKKAGIIVEKYLGDVRVTDDEAGFLTLHIVTASMNQDMNLTMKATRMIHGVLDIIQGSFSLEFDDDSLLYQRLLRHLQFFAQRVLSEKQNRCTLPLQLSRRKYQDVMTCVSEIEEYIEKNFGKKVSKAEKGYLIYHILVVVNEQK